MPSPKNKIKSSANDSSLAKQDKKSSPLKSKTSLKPNYLGIKSLMSKRTWPAASRAPKF